MINGLAEIRKLARANLLKNFNLFPNAPHLLEVERKYGDGLTAEDLSGVYMRKKRRRRNNQVS